MSGTVTPDRVVPARLPRVGYIPALDGLRALAVIAVLLYHGDLKWMPGGFLGVDVFFVISGYLITCLLLADWRETTQHRLRAVLPTAGPGACCRRSSSCSAWSSLYAFLFLPDARRRSSGATSVAALFYVENWYLIFHNRSRTSQRVGRPPMLQHVWSLAVEEQFYLLWPLIFVFLLARVGQEQRGMLLGGGGRRRRWSSTVLDGRARTTRSPIRRASTSAPTPARPRC